MEIDFQVVKRYLQGIEKKGDKDQIIDWFLQLRFEKDIETKYRDVWDELAEFTDIDDCDGAAILGSIYHKIRMDEFKNSPRNKGLVRILNIVTKVAAVLFIPLAAYLWITKVNDSPVATGTAYSEIYSPPGTRTMFYLPDGSSGWLNGDSHLEFPTEFRGKSREVLLKGEAYFDVISDKKKPFTVKSKNTVVTAHGTSFNVMAYSGDTESQITLVEGIISLSEFKNGRLFNLVDIKPDQMCIYYPGTSLYRIDTVDTEKITAWKEGKLIFRDESFNDIVKKINRWYNVEIVIKDETLKSYSYQATFIDETLDEVLKLLELSAPIEYKDLGRDKKPDGTFNKRNIELYYKPYK
jgi:transmembrane sensor